MLTLLFTVLMIVILFKFIGLAVKLSWGLMKVLLGVVFAPVLLIVFALSGFMLLAFVFLIIWGIIGFFRSA